MKTVKIGRRHLGVKVDDIDVRITEVFDEQGHSCITWNVDLYRYEMWIGSLDFERGTGTFYTRCIAPNFRDKVSLLDIEAACIAKRWAWECTEETMDIAEPSDRCTKCGHPLP